MRDDGAKAPRDSEAAHALTNCLSVILGFAELMIGELAPDDPHRADMMEIQKAAVDAHAAMARLSFADAPPPVAENFS